MNKLESMNKGQILEEILRNYFLKAGYFVVRGVPFSFEGFNVTDIDLWLYGRASSVSREITIVDIKNKRTPQAIERIFWVQGLKKAVKANGAVVATTDRREAVKNFGKDIGVVVLDGSFLKKITKSYFDNARLTEEEFVSKIDEYSLGKIDGDWKGRIISSKSLLAKKLSFDSCNEWLLHAKFFAEQSITKTKQRESALRCLYLICSYIAIGIDFSLKELSFVDFYERIKLINEGFTYGSRGNDGMKKVLDVAMGLVEQYAENGKTISNQVRKNIETELSTLNTQILGEFFAKTEVSKKLFTIAREFEYFGMQRNFLSHANSSIDMRGMLYCLFDYWGINRSIFKEN